MEIKAVSTVNAPAAIGPYSQAIAAGEFVYLSGQLGVDPATGNMENGVEAQAERAISNMKAILAEAGLDISRVIKTTVFLKDMGDFAAVNAIYAKHFQQPYPARSCVQVAELPKGGLVEIEAVCVK
ncbi:MAG: RidA family protein [Clostridia bacterium]|nr:RidA family protein [Clostridia bacterium]